MNKQQLTEQLVNLQDRMEGLREIEKKAFERKLKAKVMLEAHPAYAEILHCDTEIKEAIATWYQLYTEYLSTREKLASLKITKP